MGGLARWEGRARRQGVWVGDRHDARGDVGDSGRCPHHPETPDPGDCNETAGSFVLRDARMAMSYCALG